MSDVASNLYSWSTTASSNSPSDATTIGAGLADNFQEIQKVVRQDLASKGADIASATTTDIGAVAGKQHDITGVTTITSFGTVAAGIEKVLQFDGALTLTHSGSLILPGAVNIVTVAGDVGVFVSEGSGVWRCISFAGKNHSGTNGVFSGTLAVTGTLTAAAINASGLVAMAGAATVGTTLGVTGTATMAAINASGAVVASGLLSAASGIGEVYNLSNLTTIQKIRRPNKEYWLALDINNNGGTDFTVYDLTRSAIVLQAAGATGAVTIPGTLDVGDAITNTKSTNTTFGPVVTNSNAGIGGQARYVASNGTSQVVMGMLGTGFVTSGELQAGRGYLLNTGASLLLAAGTGSIVFSLDTGFTAHASISGTGASFAGTLGVAGLVNVGGSSPASGAAGTAGTITWDATYLYVCTASGAWKRVALTGGY